MNPIKKVFKNRHSCAWAVTSLAVIALLTTVSVMANNNQFESLIDVVLGGKTANASQSETKSFESEAENKADAFRRGNEKNIEICKEGTVLLKNENALPLKSGAKVSVFGKNAADIVRGGSGSSDGNLDGAKTIYDSLEAAGFTVNDKLKAFYADNKLSGDGRTPNPDIEEGKAELELDTGETPISKYTEAVRSSYESYKDAALIVISRIGGEGSDLPRHMMYDSSRHYLELTDTEKDLINEVTDAGFGHVVLLLNTAAPMELGFLKESGSKIDGALWIGFGGGQGIMALGSILSGETNPSGRLVDTYPMDLTKDPTYQNFGNNGIANNDAYVQDGNVTQRYFVDYEEDVYVGYRYWETRGKTDGETWYNNNVCYPFGYGLSYTTFSYELASTPSGTLDPNSVENVKVKVTNTGSTYSGKEVVQLYVDLPYTPGGIEKSSTVLAGFAKTKLLAPGESDVVDIEVNPYYFASYDYDDKNANGFKGYELEAGEYSYSINENAHVKTSITFSKTLSATAKIEKDSVTGNTVENQFEDAGEHCQSRLSRTDWEGTFPVAPTDADRVIDASVVKAKLKSTTTTNPLETAENVEMPTQGAQNGLVLQDMVGKSYNDPDWDLLIDQMTAAEMVEMFTPSGFHSAPIESIGKPKTNDSDGSVGFTNFMGDPVFYGGVWYCSATVCASTFNKDLIEEQGKVLGDEGIIGNEKGDGVSYSGIYAPGANIHRSPFGGRNSEYFSEDPLVTGRMAGSFIKGAESKGVVCYMKHFALNEQETNRAKNGCSSWCDEQAIREIYLKGFEIALKESKGHGIMSSFNRIGYTWAGGHYNLLTNVLRNEWGFEGAVISDFNTNSYMNAHQMVYAGGDIDLASQAHDTKFDLTKANDVVALRSATKHALYAVASSNLMDLVITGYNMQTWKVCLYVVDGVAAAAIAAWGFFALKPVFSKKEDVTVSE